MTTLRTTRFWWRLAVCLFNVAMGGAGALYLVVLAQLNAEPHTTTGQRVQYIGAMVLLSLAVFLTLSFALTVWILPARRAMCAMTINLLLFFLLAMVFLLLAILTLEAENWIVGALDLSFVVEALAGCVCCRLYSVRVRYDLDQKDALEITRERLSSLHWGESA